MWNPTVDLTVNSKISRFEFTTLYHYAPSTHNGTFNRICTRDGLDSIDSTNRSQLAHTEFPFYYFTKA
jgi:hypothetical protein